VTNTIGTVRLICSKSATIELAVPRTTSGFDATNSAAYLRNSSVLPAPQRVSTCTLPPSCQPNCCSACTNAASQAWPCSASVFISTPMRRIRSGCCARAGSGNAAADPAIPWMKSRRRIAAPRAQGCADLLWDVAITAGNYDRRNGVRLSFFAATILRTECPLWVKSGHYAVQ
jgi:hypothetical protein